MRCGKLKLDAVRERLRRCVKIGGYMVCEHWRLRRCLKIGGGVGVGRLVVA